MTKLGILLKQAGIPRVHAFPKISTNLSLLTLLNLEQTHCINPSAADIVLPLCPFATVAPTPRPPAFWTLPQIFWLVREDRYDTTIANSNNPFHPAEEHL